ncbi:MAG: histidinol phosphate phosphatase domain-containing protein [Candidatus Omnitrophota bacterium]|nr:MAG: histidinol phosphate phosphatase domain-containing protein [Candidatus Omnitrophota bacterium]
MIDLHTHSLLSDGVLLPSELVRRAEVKGYEAIAITDHVDFSNIDFVIPRIVRTCRISNKYRKIKAIPGAEITHVPPESINELVKFARRKGAKIVVGHGETISEPVSPGTNRAFINAGADILAHPGKISVEDIKLAKSKKVLLEITTKKNHSKTNRRLVKLALKHKAPLVLNTDTHAPEDLIDNNKRKKFLASLGVQSDDINKIIRNSYNIVINIKL